MKLTIDNKIISNNSAPYIIAEVGSNFDQDKDKAFKMIEIASKCGANAVKFQLFKARNLYSPNNPMYKIFKKIELNSSWLNELSKCAKKNKITFLASAFDFDSVDSLEKINISAYKIASSETANTSLLRYIASKNKPMLISTGMSDYIDIENAISICKKSNNNNIALLQCTSLYPCEYNKANLSVISELKSKYKKIVGFSDHTNDNLASSVAVGLGALIFEKHFTLDKTSNGPDHFYSLEPDEFKNYVTTIKNSYILKGSNEKQFIEEERMVSRKDGVYASKNLNKNHILGLKDFYFSRPAIGIDRKYSNSIKGAKVKNKIKKNDPIKWEDIL